MSAEMVKREAVLIGDVLPARPATVQVTVVVDNRDCDDCRHPASAHGSNGERCSQCGEHGCCLTQLEAAGWTAPGYCAGGCR